MMGIMSKLKSLLNPGSIQQNNQVNTRENISDYNKSYYEIMKPIIKTGPIGYDVLFEKCVDVMGTFVEDRQKDINAFLSSDEQSLILEKEPSNPYDKHAIKVIGVWNAGKRIKKGLLGYVPREIAYILRNTFDIKATVNEANEFRILFDIWVKTNSGFKPYKKEEPPTKKVEVKPYQEINIPFDPVERNKLGSSLEKEGSIDNAIELYELNINDNFEGNFPYDRLAIIYRKSRKYTDEIRVLNKAICVFKELENSTQRKDVPRKLIKFKERLETAKRLRSLN
jgi:tetratricopeptide (TPR) repeat protein